MNALHLPERLFNRDFASLNMVMFLAFCNMAVMFMVFDDLKTMPVDPRWHSILISRFPLTAFARCPGGHWFHRPGLIFGLCGVAVLGALVFVPMVSGNKGEPN